MFKRHLFRGGPEGSVHRQSIQDLWCLLVHAVRPVVRFSILLVGGIEASLSESQQAMEFTSLDRTSFSVAIAFAESQVVCAGAVLAALSVATRQ